MSTTSSVRQRDYSHLPFSKEYYDYKNERAQELSKLGTQQQKGSTTDLLLIGFSFLPISSNTSSTSPSLPRLLEVEQALAAIEKEPETASQTTLDGLLATLLDIEISTPFAYPAVRALKQDLFFLYSLLETLQTSTLSPPIGGTLILASFNQFSRPETRSSCASNVANFAKYFLSLKQISDINIGWVEKITQEGMDLYLALLENRQQGFAEVLGKITEETRKQKTTELHDELSSMQETQRKELQKQIPLLVKEAIEIARKNFWREQGGDHLAVAEVLAHPAFASLPCSVPPPTHSLPQNIIQRREYFRILLSILTKQTISKLVCTFTCNGYTYGVGIYCISQATHYVIYDSHGNLALNSSKYAFCILYEDLVSAANYLTLLVSYLDIPKALQRAGANEVAYMLFGKVHPSVQSIVSPSLSSSVEHRSSLLQKYFKEDPDLLLERNKILQNSFTFLSPLFGGRNKYDPSLLIKEYATCTLADSSTLKLRTLIYDETHSDLFPDTPGGINTYDISLLVSEYLEEYATQEKNGEANPRTLYGSDDISDYLNLMIERELGGYKRQETGTCRFLLEGNKEGFFVENSERWLVALTPAIDTGGYLPLDHFLSETSQVDNTLLTCYKKVRPFLSTLDKKSKKVLFEQLTKLLGSSYEKEVLDYLIEKLNHFAFNSKNLDEAIKNPRQQEQKSDVFRELAPFLQVPQAQVKILMPYNISQSHWLTAEIQIRKDLHAYQLRIWAHDPYGGGQMPIASFRFLSASITSRIKIFHPEATFSIPDQGELSPYTRRQNDGTSCGVIVAADILRRIRGHSLNRKSPYPPGATSLRGKHLEKMQRYLPPGQVTREKFLKRNSQPFFSLTALSPSVFPSLDNPYPPSVLPKENSFPLSLIETLNALTRKQLFPPEEATLDHALTKAIQSNQHCVWYQLGQVVSSQQSTAALVKSFFTSLPPTEEYPVQRFLVFRIIDLTLYRGLYSYSHPMLLEEVCYQAMSKVQDLASAKISMLEQELDVVCLGKKKWQQGKLLREIEQVETIVSALWQKLSPWDRRPLLSKEERNFVQEALHLHELEMEYAKELEKANLAKNYSKELRCIMKLGELYAQKREKQTVLQAAGLYSYALHLIQEPTYLQDKNASVKQARRKEIFGYLGQIELQLLRLLGVEIGSLGECLARAQRAIVHNRANLKQRRRSIDEEIDRLGEEPAPQQVREVYRLIAREMKIFIVQLIKQCIEIMGRPPCPYAFIGLGSMAREEMTPYSDLEFAILLAEGAERHREYFRNLTYLLHFKVINLGETLLPNLKIPCLNGERGIGFFDTVTPRGFAFDGAAVQGKGCKTPFGNIGNVSDKGKAFELIQTPSKMAQYIGIDRKGRDWPKEEPHLPMEMLNCTLIKGKKKLLRAYRYHLKKELALLYRGKSSVREYLAKEHLGKDDERNFDPTLGIFEKEGQLFKIKQDLYRLPHLSIDRLALLLKIRTFNTFDRIDRLQKQRTLTFEGAQRLHWLISKVTWQRLKVYIYYKAQQEWMNPMIKMFDFESPQLVQKQFALDTTSLENLTGIYQILLPFYNAIQAFLKGDSSILNKEILWDKSDFTLGQIAVRLLQYEKARKYYLKARDSIPEDGIVLNALGIVEGKLGNPIESINNLQRSLVIQKKTYGEMHPNIAVSLNNIGEVYRELGKAQEAFFYFQKALFIQEKVYDREHPNIAASLNNIGTAYRALDKFEEALFCYQRALLIRKKAYNREHPNIATSLNNIGVVYFDLGKPQEALEHYQKALFIREKIYGEKHPDVSESLNNIGTAYRALDKPEDALLCYQRALLIRKKVYGKEHSNIAASLNNIGAAHCDLGKPEKALGYYQKALAIYKKVYDKEHPNIAASLNNIGAAYCDLGKLEKALGYYQKALAIYKKVYDKEHLRVADVLTNAGIAYDSLYKPQEALEYSQKALAIRERVYGKEHPKVAGSLNNIGAAYRTLGKPQETLKYCQAALTIYEKSYGKEHPTLIRSLKNVGIAYGELGKFEEALQYSQKALAIREKVYGEEHPEVADSFNDVGSIYSALDKPKEALAYHRKALAIREKVYGEEHPKVAGSLNSIGAAYSDLGKFQQALTYQQQALAICKKVHGKEHPEVATSLNDIGAAYGGLGKPQEALKYYYKALDLRKKTYGEEHPEVAVILNNIGAVYYRDLDEPQEALKYCQEALVIYEKTYGKEHSEVANSFDNVGTTYRNLGRSQAALKYYQEALTIREKIHGREHPKVATSLNNIGVTYGELGKPEETLKYCQEALSIRKKIYGKEHSEVATSLNDIGVAYSILRKPQEALKCFQEALIIREKVHGKGHPEVAASLNNIGAVYGVLGKPQEALECFQKALAICEKVYGKAHPKVAISLNNVGVAYRSLGDRKKAEEYFAQAKAIRDKR